jgi:hypothetical protein
MDNNLVIKLALLKDYDLVEELCKKDKFIQSWTAYEKGNYTISAVLARNAMEELSPKPPFDDLRWRLIYPIHYYEIAKGRGLGLQLFISKQSKEIIDKAISTEQEPLVIKGTDFPYWFEVNGQLLPSQEKNWFLYLYNEFAIIDKSMLETLKKEPTKKA